MGRVLAIDYGLKRCGLAVTDPLKIIATALETVETSTLLPYLKNYVQKEPVDRIIMGLPVDLLNRDTHSTAGVKKFAEVLRYSFPDIPLELVDERFTSKMAKDALLASGASKKQRATKGELDKISAVIILQEFLAKY